MNFIEAIAEKYFTGDITLLGIQLIISGLLLLATLFLKPKEHPITCWDSFIIGIAQAIAIIPAISRSGATIATGLMPGNKRSEIARFSFLMVLIPVIGANLLEIYKDGFSTESTSFIVILAGFLSAFISGYFACKWMISFVKKGNPGWFALYSFLIGVFSILPGLHVF